MLLIFVAAGILAYGVHDLQEAAILPGLNTLAFDVSAAVPPDSWYGTLLKGIFNFSPQTTVLEAIVWVAYVAVVLTAVPAAPAHASAAATPAVRRPDSEEHHVPQVPRRRSLRAGIAAVALAGCTSTAPPPTPATPRAAAGPIAVKAADDALRGRRRRGAGRQRSRSR